MASDLSQSDPNQSLFGAKPNYSVRLFRKNCDTGECPWRGGNGTVLIDSSSLPRDGHMPFDYIINC